MYLGRTQTVQLVLQMHGKYELYASDKYFVHSYI